MTTANVINFTANSNKLAFSI